jgi:hypothetical protein
MRARPPERAALSSAAGQKHGRELVAEALATRMSSCQPRLHAMPLSRTKGNVIMAVPSVNAITTTPTSPYASRNTYLTTSLRHLNKKTLPIECQVDQLPSSPRPILQNHNHALPCSSALSARAARIWPDRRLCPGSLAPVPIHPFFPRDLRLGKNKKKQVIHVCLVKSAAMSGQESRMLHAPLCCLEHATGQRNAGELSLSSPASPWQ